MLFRSLVTLCNSTACTALGTPYYNTQSLNASGNCSTADSASPFTGNFTFYQNGSAYRVNLTYNWVANLTNYTNDTIPGTVLKKSDTWLVGLTCGNSTQNSTQANSSAITVNNTAPAQTAGAIVSNDTRYLNTSLLTCNNGTFTDADSDARNATAWWQWWLNDTTQLSGHTGTLNVATYKLNESDRVNCSVIVNDTGWDMKSAPKIYSPAITIGGALDLNYSFPTGQTSANFTCAQAYMNNSPPNGQTKTIPILNITSNEVTDTYYNITLYLNQSLTAGFSIWAQPSYYRNPSSVNLSTSPQIIIKRLANQSSIGLWMWGECYNVTDDQSMSFSFEFGGG